MAQVKSIPLSYWVDDYNLRVHCSYYLLGNTIHDAQRYKAGCPDFDLAGIFRYKAITGSSHKKVKVVYKRCDRNAAPFRNNTPSELVGYMEILAKNVQPENTQLLTYDNEGYLVSRTIENYNGDKLYTSRDTFLYTYNKGADGSLKVSVSVYKKAINRNKKPAKGSGFFYSSIYSGTIDKGPYKITSSGMEQYSFDAAGRPTEIHNEYIGYANGKPDYDKDNPTIRLFKYDTKGRLLSITDSATISGNIKTRESFVYKDIDARQYPVFETPLMQQYLSTINKPEFATAEYKWEYWNRESGKGFYPIDSPKGYEEHYVVMHNDKKELCLSTQIGGDGALGLPTIYRLGKDSVGSKFRTSMTVDAKAGDTESVVYDATIAPWEITVSTLDMITTNYEKPPGTWWLSNYDCTNRIVVKDTTGWSAIAYAPYGSNNLAGVGSFYAPKQSCGCGRAEGMTSFALIDTEGNMRYVYDEGDVYTISYE
ncbi:MAG: hypothetical protein EOP51_26380 [Sphingobacteriales bacterium]|nr:MAG: hypothetical protein EOP51_26380 [Sphingobacteriales bacterium]